MPSLQTLGSVCGWLYFALWSASFYPQLLLNHRHRSVSGLSLAFVALNTTGFYAYAFYTTILYAYTPAIHAFTSAYSVVPQVPLNDVVFGIHGASLCTVAVAQCATFPGGKQRIRASVTALCLASWAVLLLGSAGTVAGVVPWVGLLEAIGAVKVVCSFCKYVPQVVHNYRRKSTMGFAGAGMALDFGGGFFSITQQALRSAEVGSWVPFTRNYTKTLLAVETIAFDAILLVQHFVLYPGSEAREALKNGVFGLTGERGGLLDGQRDVDA